MTKTREDPLDHRGEQANTDDVAGIRPSSRRKRCWFRLPWFSRLSLRSRLSLAFIMLIVSSASATILIGNLLFRNKVTELESSMLQVALRVAERDFTARLLQINLLTRVAAKYVVPTAANHELCEMLTHAVEDVEWALIVHPNRVEQVLVEASDPMRFEESFGEQRQSGCRYHHFDRSAIRESTLGELIESSELGREGLSGLMVVDEVVTRALGYREPEREGLMYVSAFPITNGDVLVLGVLLNGRSELMSVPLRMIWPERSELYAATVFLGERRVATTLSQELVGSRVDEVIARRVLELGQPFVGPSQIGERLFHAAYMPLTDFRGEVIGILGIGTEEQAYKSLTQSTATLFTTLIVAGMTFGFIMTYLFSFWLVKPIQRLAQGTMRVAAGDLDHKVRVSTVDELGRLTRAFNTMVKKIKERDIQLREMTEARLSAVEKQVSIGRLAGGVAHEINNPMTSILSLSMLMRKNLPDDDPRAEDLDVIIHETTRCRDIVRSLLDFAKETSHNVHIVDLNEVIRDTLVLTRKYEGMSDINVRLELSEEPQLINGDPKRLMQVFTNLITNAAEAQQPGGQITISTDEDSSGAYIVAKVVDTGRGIAQADLARIFEPFFTTKGARKGTGLGLSVTLGIVQTHNGMIDLNSEEGEGTTATVMLPRVVPEHE